MKKYIKAMSEPKKEIASKLDSQGSEVMEHIIKYYCFPQGEAKNHWVEEMYAALHKIPRTKSNNQFPDKHFIFQSLWKLGNNQDFPKAYIAICNEYKEEGDPVISSYQTEKYVIQYFEWISEILSTEGRVIRPEIQKYLDDSV